MGVYDSYKPTTGNKDYQVKIPAFMDQVGTDMGNKAPAEHTHEGDGGEPILSRGDATNRLATGTTGHLRTGGKALELVQDGVVQAVITGQVPALRHDHATRTALRPSAAWETVHTGAAGELHLLTLNVCSTYLSSGDQEGGLSADGGATNHCGFKLPEKSGAYSLGGFLIDSASITLAVRNAADNYLSYWASLVKAPFGVKRLSGIAAGSLFLAVPASGSDTTIHTAAKRELVVVYCGRVPSSTGEVWCGASGVTTAGSGSLLAAINRDADTPPALLFAGILNAGESLKVCAEAASKFVAWGYAQEMEA